MFFLFFSPLDAQVNLPDIEGERPGAKAAKLSGIPEIDGEVLKDPVWQGLPFYGNLIQT